LCLFTVLAVTMQVGGFAIAALTYSWFLLVYLLAMLFSLVRTWPKSRRDRGEQWWSRWYAIILWWAVSAIVSAGLNTLFDKSYHSFYVASVSMKPTFEKNEKLVADMRWRTPIVGNIVLVHDHQGTVRIYRVAAIGGQTFAMRGGLPVIDGHAARQAQIGGIAFQEGSLGLQSGRLMREQLPGEAGTHRIIQLQGNGFLDDFPEVHIPAGSVFLLGDDRDLAADSRVSPEEVGVGILPVSAIVGRPLYIAWSKDRSRIGQRADH